jgi:hypothetical protein
LEGRYVKEEGWQPNYVITNSGLKISRANLIATVVSVEPGIPNNSVLIDDGTGTLSLRSFENNPQLNQVQLGEIINIIGRPRGFQEEKYLVPEIMRKITNEGWVRLRQKELDMGKVNGEPQALPGEEVIGDESQAGPVLNNPFQKIYQLIKELDKGEGADIDELVKESGLHNAEEIIRDLLKEGEIFEIRGGRLKVLE